MYAKTGGKNAKYAATNKGVSSISDIARIGVQLFEHAHAGSFRDTLSIMGSLQCKGLFSIQPHEFLALTRATPTTTRTGIDIGCTDRQAFVTFRGRKGAFANAMALFSKRDNV